MKLMVGELKAEASKDLTKRIQDEILRARERCAKIVESGICDGLSCEDKALQKAAEDIRKGVSRYGI